jgi:hypothetical protein
MGNLIKTAWKCIKWIGNCIHRVIEWWGPFKEGVNRNTYNYLIGKQNAIVTAQNPVGVGEVLAINNEKSQLEDIADRKYMSLSMRDQQRVDELLEERNY